MNVNITNLKIMDKIVDRISNLSPFIIHHIMSYLSAKEVAQISILWNQLRICFPIFDFDQTYFLIRDESAHVTSVFEKKSLALHDRLKEFMEFVDVSLLRFCELKFCMHKFRIFLSILDAKESAPYIDKWIGLAIEKGVKELDLQFLTESNAQYTLPQTIFSAGSVTTLKLVNCRLENTSDTIRFNSLIKLSLDSVFIHEEMVQKLSSECPLLEEIFFSECWGLK
ncbi:FBD-associated F-box protein At5g56370-like [Pistacia vera]|uniref:FBD-associated F-box protein At5g56370-like n=1 Tax=Pistacia vera TaxID=55513 RepID=UPI0012632128|nr:FBD-associated F-box protein At5g56370-like [Pistacia vera]